jgi:PAS domain S-box-containing protein
MRVVGVSSGGESGAEQRDFRGLLEALPAAIYTTDAAGRITFYNRAAVALWGREPELGNDSWCGSWRLYHRDGTFMPHPECPMAVALRDNRPIAGAPAVAERPDGTWVPFRAYPTPLQDAHGKLVGAINMLVDDSASLEAERAAQRLAAIVSSSDDAIVSKNLDGFIMTWNAGAERLFGYSAAEVIGQPITIVIPPDRLHEEPMILGRIRSGERVDHYETVRRRKDGRLVDVSLTISPVRDASGVIVGASKIARDITERRRAEEQQNLLIREMNHRIKNLFALASGVVALSLMAAKIPGDVVDAVRGRLGALSRAHALSLPNLRADGPQEERVTDLRTLIATIVAPYADVDAGRVVIEGPAVPIGGDAVTGFALLLHELATNAVKYGALAKPGGRLDVRWSAADGRLDLTWSEHGTAAGTVPPTEGFGSMLARRSVTDRLGGEISRDWTGDGLAVRLVAPLDRLRA